MQDILTKTAGVSGASKAPQTSSTVTISPAGVTKVESQFRDSSLNLCNDRRGSSLSLAVVDDLDEVPAEANRILSCGKSLLQGEVQLHQTSFVVNPALMPLMPYC